MCSADMEMPFDDGLDDIDLPDDLGSECTGRIVTELVDATAEGGKGALPDRFMYAMRAIRGEFSPDDANDTELAEDSLTAALITFPALVRLRIVSRPLPEAELDSLVRDISLLASQLDAAGAGEVGFTVRGSRRSIDFAATLPDAASISAMRYTLKADARVQMVF